MDKLQELGVCAVLVDISGRVLFGKRKNSYKAGFYGLPGGRIELNEPIAAAIHREVLEETGLDLPDLKFVGVIRENQGPYDFIHFVFTGSVGNASPQLCEPEKCEGWEWFADVSKVSPLLNGHQAAIKLCAEQQTLTDITSPE